MIRYRMLELPHADDVRYEVAELDEAAFRAALLAKLGEEVAEVAAAHLFGARRSGFAPRPSRRGVVALLLPNGRITRFVPPMNIVT